MLTLTIHHNIFIDRTQRYALHRGDDVTTTGVSVPVWYDEPFTTEPAKEIFCRYTLQNRGGDAPIKINDDGYTIILPHRLQLNADGSAIDARDEPQRDLVDDLLDFADGGASSIYYREHNKVVHNKQYLHIVHFVQIRDVESMLNSSTVEA